MITPFQFVFWNSLYFLLTLLFAGYSPFYICLFLFSFAFLSPFSAYFSVLSNFLARVSRPRLTPFTSCFLWPLCLFLSSLFSLKTLSPQTWIIKISSGWHLALPVLLLCKLIKKKSRILRITVQRQPHQFDFPLKTRVANYLLTRPHIYKPTWTPRVMPNCEHAVRCTKSRRSSICTSLWSGGVSWRTPMGYPS